MSNKITIDLTGPSGNAFVLLGMARTLSIKYGLDPDKILTEMKSSDYTNLVDTMKKYFGKYITFVT